MKGDESSPIQQTNHQHTSPCDAVWSGQHVLGREAFEDKENKVLSRCRFTAHFFREDFVVLRCNASQGVDLGGLWFVMSWHPDQSGCSREDFGFETHGITGGGPCGALVCDVMGAPAGRGVLGKILWF